MKSLILTAQSLVAQSQILLTWTNSGYSTKSYKVLKANHAAGPWTTIATVSVNTNKFQDSNVSFGVTFYYKIEINNGKNVIYSNIVSIVINLPLSPPMLELISDTLNQQVTLSWTKPVFSSAFDVIRSNDINTSSVVALQTTGFNFTDTTPFDTCQTTSVYTYQVISKNNVEQSSPSNPQLIAYHADVNNGFDPVLGPAYPPIDYELFIQPNRQRLLWTVPSVEIDQFKIYNLTPNFLYIWRRTIPTASNSPEDSVEQYPDGNYIRTESPNLTGSYLWFTLTTQRPSASNIVLGPTLIPEASNVVWPSPAPCNVLWDGQRIKFSGAPPGDTITSFTASRSTDGVNFTPIAYLGGAERSYKDTFLAPNIYYRLTGSTNTFQFRYNDVSMSIVIPSFKIPTIDINTVLRVCKFVKGNDRYFCSLYIANINYNYSLHALVWNELGEYEDILLPGYPSTLVDTFELTDDDTVVVASEDDDTKNFIYEYVLENFTNRLPTTARMSKEPIQWSEFPNGRVVESIKTPSGTIIISTYRFVFNSASYNNDIGYRTPSGDWNFTYRQYVDLGATGPSQTMCMAMDSLNTLHIFSDRDASDVISLARWLDTGTGLTFLDFREDFLSTQTDNFGVLRDGEMAPDVEYSQPTVNYDPFNNRLLLFYQTVTGSIGDTVCFRLTPLTITSVNTFPQPQSGSITNLSQIGNAYFITYSGEIGIPYYFQVSADSGSSWTTYGDSNSATQDNISTSTTGSFYFVTLLNNPQFRVLARPYIRRTVFTTFSPPEFVGRAEPHFSLIARTGSIDWYVKPRCNDVPDYYLKRYTYITKIESDLNGGMPIDEIPLAIANTVLSPQYRVINKNGMLYVTSVINTPIL